VGLVAETFAGWLIPIWLMYLLGIVVGIGETKENSKK
jgi:hypothetical protein